MQEDNLVKATEPAGTLVQFPISLPRRILVVDQDPYICHLSADVLIRHGYEVNAVEDGVAGWEELQSNLYNLLITEHDLPKISGVRLVRKVRAARLDLPVVMIAKRFPPRLTRNPALQLAATFLKPLPVDALLDKVKIILCATVCPPEQNVPPTVTQNPPAPDSWQLKLSAAAAGTASQVRKASYNDYGAYAHWGLNE